MLILIMIITSTNICPDHGVGSGVIKAFRQWLSQQLLLIHRILYHQFNFSSLVGHEIRNEERYRPPIRRRSNKIVLPKKYGAEEIIYESACRQAFQQPTAAFHWGKVRTAHKFWWTLASWLDTQHLFVCMFQEIDHMVVFDLHCWLRLQVLRRLPPRWLRVVTTRASHFLLVLSHAAGLLRQSLPPVILMHM